MREKLRLFILETYGVDITKTGFQYRESLSSYVFNLGDRTLRISIAEKEKRDIRSAKAHWASELKSAKETICEPIPSNNNKLVEHLKVGKWEFLISMYRTAKGRVLEAIDIKPMFLISAGDMLGGIHKTSMEKSIDGIEYHIPTDLELFEQRRVKIDSMLSADLRSAIHEVAKQMHNIEKTPENYGVCYGDYDLNSMIVDTNNIYLFDFDLSLYSNYMYDVASFVVSILSSGYHPKRASRDIIHNIFIPWFRIGYSINKPCDNHTFDNIELFIRARICWLLTCLLERSTKDEEGHADKQIENLANILLADNTYLGIDKIRKLHIPITDSVTD